MLGTFTDQEVDVFCLCPFGILGSFSSQTWSLDEGNEPSVDLRTALMICESSLIVLQ